MNGFMLLLFIILSMVLADSSEAYTSEDCVKCHVEGSMRSRLHISSDQFDASVHGGKLTCQGCHVGIEDEDHARRKGSGAVDCNQCHDQENRHGLASTGEDRPRCYSCHTRHRILEKENKRSSVNRERLGETCQKCHPFECGETDYLSWLPSIRMLSHGKQNLAQAYEKGNCVGCHQGQAAHGERESIDAQNCSVCHLDLHGEGTLWGRMHPRASLKKQPSIFAAATIYQAFLVVLVWGGVRFYLRRFSGDKRRR